MIENTVASVVYTADGAQTQWTIPFAYGHAEDVKLFVKVGTADIAPVASNLYSIDTELNTITYPLSGDPLAANDKVIVMRVTEQTQEESSAMLSFKSEDIERMADKLTMEVQELQEQLSRCIAFNPVDAAEGELDAQQYIDDLTELKDIATTQATIATTKAGEAATSATASEASKVKSQKWAEGSDADVTALGGTHSAKGWAAQAGEYANSEKITTVANNIDNINTVAGIDSDVTTVSGIHSHVTTVATHIDNIDTVAADTTNIDTVAESITDVNTVAAQASAVATVAGISSDVTTLATNVSDVSAVADDIAKVTSVADDLSNIDAVKNNLTEINAVNDNKTNINAVAANATNINAVNANKTNIDAVAGNATNINTVATNISDVNDVADDITKVSAVANDLTAINAVNNNKTNIDTVSTNISDVTSVAAAIADVSAVADDLTNIDNVADDLTNIDTVAASLPDIQDKQNKVLTNSVILGGETQTTVEGALEAISEDWVKPADWVDIRSGALNNSIYLLVAHSVPTESGGVYSIANYPKFSFRVFLESEGTSTADIFVDGIKIDKALHFTSYVIDWESLYNSGKVQTVYTTTHPSSLAYHIVRITPTTSTDKIFWFRTIAIGNQTEQGIMWAHYQLDNAINMSSAFGSPSSIRNYLLEAVTSKNNKIIYKCSASDSSSGFYSAFSACTSLVQIPILEAENKNYPSGVYTAFQGVPAKKVTIKNNTGLETIYCLSGTTIQEIDVENGLVLNNGSTASINIQCNKLKKFPNISQLVEGEYLVLSRFDSLAPTVINDFSTARKRFRFYGTSSHRTDGLKGLIVSNQAPFDSETSPQININYTGLNRAALVNLFKSMPYNNSLTLTGNTTITDGVLGNVDGDSSASTLLTIPSGYKKIEMLLKIGYSETLSNNAYIPICCFGNATNSQKKITLTTSSGNGLHFDVSNSDSYVSVVRNTDFNFVSAVNDNGFFYTKFIVEKAVSGYDCTVSASTDGTTWVDGNTYNSDTDLFSGYHIYFNRNATGAVSGRALLYLNDSSIKFDGVEWGQLTTPTAMTKTCSVVGCTGTADLTADDKAICTGKGWELTVA